MPTFILSLNWTDQGIRSVKDAPKRAEASKELARKVGVEIKEVYLTSGDNDLVIIVDAPNGDNVAKFALALGALGNVRTRTARAWPQSEFQKLIRRLGPFSAVPPHWRPLSTCRPEWRAHQAGLASNPS
jgi:uncharacterized protein with GYD domain